MLTSYGICLQSASPTNLTMVDKGEKKGKSRVQRSKYFENKNNFSGNIKKTFVTITDISKITILFHVYQYVEKYLKGLFSIMFLSSLK